jgi:hypothetical protein
MRWLLVALAACSGKTDEPAGGTASGSAAPQKQPDDGLPAEVRAWMPANAADAWQGAWVTRLTIKTSGKMSLAGDPAAISIAGDKATIFDGVSEQVLGFKIDSPCSVGFSKSEAGATYTFPKSFAIRATTALVGDGPVGYRKGKTALVCTGFDGIAVVGDQGCQMWKQKFGREWKSEPGVCAWSTESGKDTLTIGKTKVTADGNVLMSDTFAETSKLGEKVASFDAAKQAVKANEAR